MDQTKNFIAELHAGKRYRPTVVNLLYQIEGNHPYMLLVKSKNTTHWGPVKGGIEEGESLDAAFNRETKEELDISPSAMTDRVYNILPPACIDYEGDSRKKKGFNEGKAYFWCGARLLPGVTITHNPKEVLQTVWVESGRMQIWLPQGRPGRNAYYARALETLLKSVRHPSSP
jgi:8-oxo-dGTP pyrophosphatase MutT (NUDIX family)